MVFNTMVYLQNPVDEKFREDLKNAVRTFPEDGWDPTTQTPIKCYPSSVKAKIDAKTKVVDRQAKALSATGDFPQRIPVNQVDELSSGYYNKVAKAEKPGMPPKPKHGAFVTN